MEIIMKIVAGVILFCAGSEMGGAMVEESWNRFFIGVLLLISGVILFTEKII